MHFIIILCCPTAGQRPSFPPSTSSGLLQFWVSPLARSPALILVVYFLTDWSEKKRKDKNKNGFLLEHSSCACHDLLSNDLIGQFKIY